MFTEWRDLLPLYASADVEIPVKVYEPKREQKQKQARTHVKPARMQAEEKAARFWRKNKITVLGAVFLMLWTVVTCCITGSVVRKRTTAEVTSELRAGFSDYLAQIEQEQKAKEFLTGDDSFAASVDFIVEPMAQLIASFSQDYGIPEAGLKTIGWVFCARCAQNSTEFGLTPDEILKKPGAWEGNPVGHAVRNQDKEIAEKIAREFLSGQYPDIYTIAHRWFERDGKDIIARDEYNTGPRTTYWWYGKK